MNKPAINKNAICIRYGRADNGLREIFTERFGSAVLLEVSGIQT